MIFFEQGTETSILGGRNILSDIKIESWNVACI